MVPREMSPLCRKTTTAKVIVLSLYKNMEISPYTEDTNTTNSCWCISNKGSKQIQGFGKLVRFNTEWKSELEINLCSVLDSAVDLA